MQDDVNQEESEQDEVDGMKQEEDSRAEVTQKDTVQNTLVPIVRSTDQRVYNASYRHAAATATPAGPVCPHCGRICASDFTVSAVIFVSTNDRTTDNYISATSSSKTTDYYKQASKLRKSRQLSTIH